MSTASTDAGLTGMLSGHGHDQLRVTVLTGEVPHHAPRELEGSVTPVYDDEGHLYDWRIDPAHADHSLQAQDFQRFAAWRSGFATERFLGERVLIVSFLDWASQKCDVSTLQVLRLDHCHLNEGRALALDRQLGELRRYLDAHPATGYGLFASSASKPIRGLVPADEPGLVLGLGSDRVTIAADGLRLHTVGAEHLIQSWQVSDGAVTANDDLQLGSSPAARLLRIVGRQATSVRVERCPLSSLVGPLLSFGKEAADLAVTGRTGLYFRSSWA
ncbi:MAG TPA: hypothetical protein VHO01_03515 [Jatrophihabitans sp.]|nr:hypothetical protein [Jatrophihabitans sp.]